MSTPSKPSCTWTFSWFGYTPDDEERLIQMEQIAYLCYGHEVCPTTSRPHLQGYLTLFKPQRLSWMRANLSDKAHWEIAKKNELANKRYCGKQSELTEIDRRTRRKKTQKETNPREKKQISEINLARVANNLPPLDWSDLFR